MGTITCVNDDDYRRIIARAEEIFHALPNTKEGDELEALAAAIVQYEDVHHPMYFETPQEEADAMAEALADGDISIVIYNGWKRTRVHHIDKARFEWDINIPTPTDA